MAIAHAISTTERLVLILQSITLRQQTGRLSLEAVADEGSEKGEIFFVNGDAVHAHTEHESGKPAITRMLSWREVRYAFLADPEAPQQNRHRQFLGQFLAPPSHMPRLCAVELEETLETPSVKVPALPTAQGTAFVTPPPQEEGFSVQASEKMGAWSVFAIFRARPYATTPYVLRRMERRERIVLLLLNGKRTLRDVSRLVHRRELDIAHVLVRMLKQGYIEFMGG
jgi:hypothetical protein